MKQVTIHRLISPAFLWVSFDAILNLVAVQRKRPFIERVLSYWVQKRQSRNNVPLIRRLQANPQPTKSKQTVGAADTHFTHFLPSKHCSLTYVSLKRACLCAETGGDEPGAEGAAEGVAPPPPRPGASSPAAGAHQEEGEAEEGGGRVPNCKHCN